MAVFWTSISGIMVILGMILVGFVMGEKGWFDDKSRGLIAKLVTQIALPCYMLYTITQRFTAADLLKMLPELRFPHGFRECGVSDTGTSWRPSAAPPQ